MSDMRLIVAGAGGRMGRTLVHAIAATDGAILAGAVEGEDETQEERFRPAVLRAAHRLQEPHLLTLTHSRGEP